MRHDGAVEQAGRSRDAERGLVVGSTSESNGGKGERGIKYDS